MSRVNWYRSMGGSVTLTAMPEPPSSDQILLWATIAMSDHLPHRSAIGKQASCLQLWTSGYLGLRDSHRTVQNLVQHAQVSFI